MLQTPTKTTLYTELDTDEVHQSVSRTHNNPPLYPQHVFSQSTTELQSMPTDFSVSENDTTRPAEHRTSLTNHDAPLSESIGYNSVRDTNRYQYWTTPQPTPAPTPTPTNLSKRAHAHAHDTTTSSAKTTTSDH